MDDRWTEYLSKYCRWPLRGLRRLGLKESPLAIVIPAYDEPELDKTIQSLLHCRSPERPLLVLVLQNAPIERKNELRSLHREQDRRLHRMWNQNRSRDRDRLVFVEYFFEKKWAGAGSARKAGTDEIIHWLSRTGLTDALIAYLDADCLVDSNYLVELEQAYESSPETDIWSIYFEHELSEIEEEAQKKSMALFELHLRYYRQSLKWCGFPYAFHTIGSCMAFRASAYVKWAGMNRKKAGEDFYFFQKIASHGRASDLITTCVYPSARISDRVPFGTGQAIAEQMDSGLERQTFDFNSFRALRPLFEFIESSEELHAVRAREILGEFHPLLQNFLEAHHFEKHWQEHGRHTPNDLAFRERFYQWMGGARIFKWLHYARDRDWSDKSVTEQAKHALQEWGINIDTGGISELLEIFRSMDRRENQ